MKNKITLICLISAAVILAGAFIVQAAGFVSFEDNDKIILWDPVRLAGKGLKMSDLGINDLEQVSDGVIKVDNKDLYVRSFMGFNCSNYPADTGSCTTKIGDIGGSAFLSIDTVKGETLTLSAPQSGIVLNPSGNIIISGQMILQNENNQNDLILLSDAYKSQYQSKITANPINSIFVDKLYTKILLGDTLAFPNIKFDSGAIFETNRIINISL